MEFPLVHAGVGRGEVAAFWRAQSFDLELAADGSESNCRYCFLKGRGRLVRLMRAALKRQKETGEDPGIDWWIDQEKAVRLQAVRLASRPPQVEKANPRAVLQ